MLDTSRFFRRRATILLVATLVFCSSLSFAAERKIKSRVTPQYPEIARRSKVSGSVRLEIVIAANGTVKSVRALGGHPMLIEAATDAVTKWKYEPGEETTSIVELKFVLDQ